MAHLLDYKKLPKAKTINITMNAFKALQSAKMKLAKSVGFEPSNSDIILYLCHKATEKNDKH